MKFASESGPGGFSYSGMPPPDRIKLLNSLASVVTAKGLPIAEREISKFYLSFDNSTLDEKESGAAKKEMISLASIFGGTLNIWWDPQYVEGY